MFKKKYGLIGENISYSFSKNYFTERFLKEDVADCFYENFDIQDIREFRTIIKNNPDLAGLNVTIPYKETIIPYLDKLSKKARKIGAVNVIRFTKKGKLKGYNSDCFGFKKSLKPLLQLHHNKALILGTGGASKAVAFALRELNIEYTFVSREVTESDFTYDDINAKIFDNYQIIINCTPIGTFPKTAEYPQIPYVFFNQKHIAFDLIYNPDESLFLKKAKQYGAQTKNGYEMLLFQAEKSWKIWNK
jgi:shikimate dehydrogenase